MRKAFSHVLVWLLLGLVPAWAQGVWELYDTRVETVKDTSFTPGEWVAGEGSVAIRKAWYSANADKNFLIISTFGWQGIPLTLQSGQDFNTAVWIDQQANTETGCNCMIKLYASVDDGVETDGPEAIASWREPVCHRESRGTLRAPTSGSKYVIRVLSKVGDSYTVYYTYRYVEGASSQGGATTPLAGEWVGTWSNSVGESGPDTLSLREDGSGNLSGTWSGYVQVQGRRLSATELELRGSTEKRAFTIRGHVEGGQLVLRYTASRLDGQGSYDGESRFRRR